MESPINDSAQALREHFIGDVWSTGTFPEKVAEVVLDGVEEGWEKTYSGEWRHHMLRPFTKKQQRHLSEWLDWEERFPFLPARNWSKRARVTRDGYIEFRPPTHLIHNRFIRVRINHNPPLWDELLSLQIHLGRKNPSFRLNLSRLEIVAYVIKKSDWRVPTNP